MAKDYRTIRFITSTGTIEIDVNTENEEPQLEETSSIFTALSGKQYKHTTGDIVGFEYSFDYCNDEVYNFFVQANNDDQVTFEREEDDGTFTSYTESFVSKPIPVSETVGTDNKVYRDIDVIVRAQ